MVCRGEEEVIMKQLFAMLLILGGAICSARADGYPFDAETQEVKVDSMRFRLSAEQVEAISATGVVTFSPEQLTVIRRLYPAASAKQPVIAATFNDSVEGLDDDHIDCFWVRADEIAVTIDRTVMADPAKAKKALRQTPAIPPDPNAVRLSPDGQIYHHGKRIDLREAFDLIAAVRRSKREGEVFEFRVVVPPQYSPDRELDGGTANSKVRELFAALKSHGETLGVPVFKSW